MTDNRVDLRTPDGVMDVYAFVPPGGGTHPAVIVYMDAFGVRPELAGMAQRLASAGYVVVLPNLYYRTPFEPFDPHEVQHDGPERDRFKGMIQTIDGPTVMRDTEAMLGFIDQRAEVKQGKLGVVGYCMGGGYALRAAATFPERVAAAASFHGGSLATDRPNSPHLLADKIRGRVYVGAAEIDPSFPKDQQDRLEEAYRAADVDYELEIYPGVKHGFAVVGHLVYDAAASERHWDTLLKLLGETL